jgi:hypothetical protein
MELLTIESSIAHVLDLHPELVSCLASKRVRAATGDESCVKPVMNAGIGTGLGRHLCMADLELEASDETDAVLGNQMSA